MGGGERESKRETERVRESFGIGVELLGETEGREKQDERNEERKKEKLERKRVPKENERENKRACAVRECRWRGTSAASWTCLAPFWLLTSCGAYTKSPCGITTAVCT